MSDWVNTTLLSESSASSIAANNVAKRQYQKDYMEYWNGTKELTSTGRPVDAIIVPVAPYPSARPQLYRYYTYTTFVNLLDYSSCTIPVTTVDPKVDVKDADYKPRNEQDRLVAESCKRVFSHYKGFYS